MNSLPGNTCITLEKAHRCAFSRVGDQEESHPYSNKKLNQGQSCTWLRFGREEI